MLLQEGFRKTSDLAYEASHLIITAPALEGNLRCPAIIVHSDLASQTKVLGGAARWVAAELKMSVRRPLLLISAHLPLSRAPTEQLIKVLEDIESMMQKYPRHEIVLGMDANCKVAGLTDFFTIGSGVPASTMRAKDMDRATILQNFLCRSQLSLQNTWADFCCPDDLHTRTDWEGNQGAQIDFVATSMSVHIKSCELGQIGFMKTDHRPILRDIEIKGKDCMHNKQPRGIARRRNWKPGEQWKPHCANQAWCWADWQTSASHLVEAAQDHAHPSCWRVKDEVLEDLQEQLKLAKQRKGELNAQEFKELSRKVWRRRRYLRRQKAVRNLNEAAATGRAPEVRSRGRHIDFRRVFGDGDPATEVHDHYVKLFNVCPERKEHSLGTAEAWCTLWQDVKKDEHKMHITTDKLKKAIKKLKMGKTSEDGVVAEMLRELPEEALESMAADMDR